MSNESDYTDYFYNSYHGRIAIGVGYNANLSEIYPLIFKTPEGESIGIVALGIISNGKTVVHIYHLGAFQSGMGKGSVILKELCRQADRFNIYLSTSPVAMPNGKDKTIKTDKLIQWYRRYGFQGDAGLLRKPNRTK